MTMKFSLCLGVSFVLISALSAASLRDPIHSQTFHAEKHKLGRNVGDIWKDCSDPSDPMKIISVTLQPDPPTRGSTITATASISLTEQVTGGSIKIELKWGFIKVYDGSVDLCDTLKDAGLACPLAAGNHTITSSQKIPGEAPGGHYTGSVVATDQSSKQLACIDLDFHM